MDLRAYKTVDVSLPDDNTLEESPSTASDSERLLHHDLEFQEARTGEQPRWKTIFQSFALGRARRSYTLRSKEGSCAQCVKTSSARRTHFRQCAFVGLWIFASL